MSEDSWILYGFPALAICLAAAGILFAYLSAARFDRTFGREPPPAPSPRDTLTIDVQGLSPRARGEIERILRRESARHTPPRHAAE